jgi:hypothetical protein
MVAVVNGWWQCKPTFWDGDLRKRAGLREHVGDSGWEKAGNVRHLAREVRGPRRRGGSGGLRGWGRGWGCSSLDELGHGNVEGWEVGGGRGGSNVWRR